MFSVAPWLSLLDTVAACQPNGPIGPSTHATLCAI